MENTKKFRGQASSEYMMVVAVCIVAIVAAAFEFVPSFHRGVHGLATDVKSFLASNSLSQTDDGGVSGSTEHAGGTNCREIRPGVETCQD